jgi:pilus assembly protein CpaF
MTHDAVVDRVRARLVQRGERPHADRVAALVRDEAPLLGQLEVDAAVATVVAALEGLGPLEPLVRDAAVTDVLVNGDGSVWVERRGRLEQTAVVLGRADVERLIERIVAPLGLRADRASPLVDARLPDGSRVHAVVPPLAVDGPCLTIRRFGAVDVGLSSFASAAVAALLRDAVRRGANVVVAGGTGAGKTTLLNALAAEIPRGQRIITVEDAAELRLPQPHVVRLESRPANAEGVGSVAVRELVRNALRMRPDRLVVGECRGAEALDMLQAMNTGHDGSCGWTPDIANGHGTLRTTLRV